MASVDCPCAGYIVRTPMTPWAPLNKLKITGTGANQSDWTAVLPAEHGLEIDWSLEQRYDGKRKRYRVKSPGGQEYTSLSKAVDNPIVLQPTTARLGAFAWSIPQLELRRYQVPSAEGERQPLLPPAGFRRRQVRKLLPSPFPTTQVARRSYSSFTCGGGGPARSQQQHKLSR
eukprot:scaffold5364_cov164-Amphora_coffeaeformis.AAC.28